MEITKDEHTPEKAGGKRLAGMVLAALGIVYGDIGTSPLYAIRECFHGQHAVAVNEANILGVLSLIIWSLVLVISVKYMILVLRMDNDGEGGILALMALLLPQKEEKLKRGLRFVPILGIFGAALLYGDGIITPAISVLSAVEGLEIATKVFEPYVVPIAAGILLGLFLFQSHGTRGVGYLFGPVMLVWFATLAVLGISEIVQQPHVLLAFNPIYGLAFFLKNGIGGFMILGLVFLVVTGGEALYADLGHFGTRPIRMGWFGLVLIGLLLNYMGQGALLLSHPEAAVNPFYRIAPDWALYPLIVIATMATIIASQAVISGAFSLTFQAVQLGYLPRLNVIHTSAKQFGQIYMPVVNRLLMVATLGVVIGFQRSNALASAYGVAVTTTMVITDVLLFLVMHRIWKWNLAISLSISIFFLLIDLSFFGANIVKVADGGWLPLLIAAGISLIMSTWRKGRLLVKKQVESAVRPLGKFIGRVKRSKLKRLPGFAVYLTANPDTAPTSLVYNYEFNRTLHKRIIMLTINTRTDAARVIKDRIDMKRFGDGFYQVIANYGFMEKPNAELILEHLEEQGLSVDLEKTTFYLGHERPLPTPKEGMAIWREKFYAFLVRNAQKATDFFQIPQERVLEINVNIEI